MMLISSLFVAHLVMAQTTVIVTKNDGMTVADAIVKVRSGGKEIRSSVPTDKSGATLLERVSEFRGPEFLYAEKDGLQSDGRRWRDVSRDDPIHLKLPPERKRCTYIVEKPVYYIMPDGRQVCGVVYETKVKDCGPATPLQYPIPTAQPPPGYKYELVFVETWSNAQRRENYYRPFYRLVPACQQSYVVAAPCGCQ